MSSIQNSYDLHLKSRLLLCKEEIIWNGLNLLTSAVKVAQAVRRHWCIENNLHRQLNVNFDEDDSDVNTGHTAENLATFRRITLNILGSWKGLLERRRKAAWNEDFLTEIVMKFFINFF